MRVAMAVAAGITGADRESIEIEATGIVSP